LEIVRALADKDTFVVKLSSNAVFDGQSPRQPACGPYRPQILYGEQHRELDERLMGLGIGAAIVRFAKVMAPQVPIFDSWIEAWSRNQVVRPLKDLSLAPISLPFIVELIARAGLTRESGIFQASGDQDVSYAQACLAAAGCLDVSRELVRPATVEELGLKLDWHPLHTTLDMTETTRLFRVTPPTIDDVVKVLAPSPLASLS
jgi:dTDP-4-dehydrorhamnose reductase